MTELTKFIGITVDELPADPNFSDSRLATATDPTTGKMYKVATEQWISLLSSISVASQGAAEPSTDPGTPEKGQFYIATEEGTYTNFKDSTGTSLTVGASDGMVIFSYDGTAWTKQVVNINIPIASAVMSNDTSKAVSGKAVADFISPIANVVNYLAFVLKPGGVNDTNGIPATSVNWLRTDYTPVAANTTYSIAGYGHGSGTDVIDTRRVFFYKSDNTFISYIGSGTTFNTFVFTTPADCAKIIVQVAVGANVGVDPANSPYNSTFSIREGTEDAFLRAEKIKGTITTPQIVTIQSQADYAYNSIDKLTQIRYTTVNVGNLTSGYINKSGTTLLADGYTRTTVSDDTKMVKVAAGKDYYYNGTIDLGDAVGVAYFSSSLAFLGYQCTIGTYTHEKLTLPNDTAYIAFSGKNPSVEIGDFELKSSSTLYVDASYSGSSDGSVTAPFTKINDAIAVVAAGGATIRIAQGDYRETLDFGSLGNGTFNFIVQNGAKVRILGSTKITGWTKTTGQTNVYQASFTGTIKAGTRFGKLLFEDGRPSQPISASERHPVQRSLAYRLPFSVLTEKSSIAAVDSAAGTFYHDTSAGVIYIHTNDGGAPAYGIEVITRNFNTVKDAKTKDVTNLELMNLQFLYGNNGVAFTGFSSVRRENVSSIAVNGNGSFRDDTGFVMSINDEAAFCDGDGFNGHFSSFAGYDTLTDNRSMSPLAVYIDPWAHDNWDDGISMHENSRIITQGGLTEYNQDGGLKGSNDGGFTVYSLHARGNGYGPEGPTGGEGICAVNDKLNPNRQGCTVVCFNVVSENNHRGFGTIASTNRVIMHDCVSRNNTQAELYAGAGTIVTRNSRATNADSSKIKVTANGGTITVINDEIIT